MDAARRRIVQAINAGAPLYNQGKIRECRDLYMTTAKMMLSEAQLPPNVAKALSNSCTESWNNANPDTGAWAMRRCFDSILNGSISDGGDEVAPLWASQGEISLLDYSSSPEALLVPSWRPMDDQVMGGRSESAFMWSPSLGSAIFTGNVTTANNGGFASCRSEGWDEYGSKLKGAKGIRLVIRGDGRTYKLSAKTEDTWDGVMYQQDFGTKAASGDEEWETVDLAFSRFKPTFRGQLVNGRPPLTGSKIRQLGFMYSKFSDSGGITPGFTTGNFRLAIRGIRGFV